jgi:hypothetical protein
VEFGEQGEELMIFGARHSDGAAAENGMVAKHPMLRFE